ncbi:hypothetical protein FHETE_10914 [Fusarium heterosporum]|uniref:Uncharacterized protein n=1 Tax=Fusarium heterosporum TaxID=42747 RepID=A0A8H5SRX1_FUSHE|nr:hypothetical protein FHETE_10914 [Fusarium heterosporum]
MLKRSNSQEHAIRKMAAVGETAENRRRVLQTDFSPGESQLLPDQQTQDRIQNAGDRERLREVDATMAILQVERNYLQGQIKSTDTPGRMDHESPVPLYQNLIAQDEIRKINELRSEIERLRSDKKALVSQRASLMESIEVVQGYFAGCQAAVLSQKQNLLSWCDPAIIQLLKEAGMTKANIERLKSLVRGKASETK